MGLISMNASAAEQGSTMGVAQSAGTLARIIGPVLATSLYAVRPPLPYLVAAGIAVVAGLLAWQFLRGQSHIVPVEGQNQTPGTV